MCLCRDAKAGLIGCAPVATTLYLMLPTLAYYCEIALAGIPGAAIVPHRRGNPLGRSYPCP
jgi:hypothetical protein